MATFLPVLHCARWFGRGGVLILLLAHLAHAGEIPDFNHVRAGHGASDALLLDRHGEPLQAMRLDPDRRRLAWVALTAMSPVLPQAVIASEDQRFYQHGGVDWQAIGKAASERLAGSPRGASTLTMQLAGLLDDDLKARSGGRSLLRKLDQAASALAIERSWSKSQILEAYLNLAPFRGELQGVAAAARQLFDKRPDGLNQGESLLLAALLRGPNANAQQLGRRACDLAAKLKSRASCPYLEGLATQALVAGDRAYHAWNDAPELARRLLTQPGTTLASSLDAGLQRAVRQILARQIAGLAERNVQDAAAIVLDNASGEVLAYAGNIGRNASARFVDGIQARRQAGSTLKPFLYELAFERRLITAASLLDDAPLSIETPSGLYLPQNYDRNFHGPLSARTSLASSLNTPAVRTLVLTGMEPFFARLNLLGFGLPQSAAYYGFSLALGSADVTLLDLANAYRTLANAGRRSAVSYLPGSKPRFERIMSAEAAWLTADILADRSARSLTFGLENPLSTRFWTAVKTGTSKDMRDNWCVGFSRRYTVAVWVGNFDGTSMWDVSGVSGAAPAWLEIMNRLHATATSRPAPPPAGLLAMPIRFDPAVEPPRKEWFLAGTVQSVISLAGNETSWILYPEPGEVIALDPDIPPENQQVLLRARRSARWLLDGVQIAAAGSAIRWQPRPGKHVLVLVGPNATRDSVQFEVRGVQP